jgi:uncharacterized protein (TIGR04255 family)
MARPRHLDRAPIREALVDIAAKLPEHVDMTALRTLSESISADYPQCGTVVQAHFQFKPQEPNTAPIERQELGFRCSNAENNRIVQFRVNGFTYNWLKPYSTWEELRAVSEKYWRMFNEAVRPVGVNRLSLRYINDVELPLPLKDFGEYLTADPKVPTELPQAMSNFLTRVGIVDEVENIDATITQVFEGVTNPAVARIILDIEASKLVNFVPDQYEKIWSILDTLRDFKNTIFFSTLTEKAVRLFE